MIETTMKASQRLDLESLDSKDVIEIPSMNYLCVFNGSSPPDQSHGFLGHVSMADNVSVKKNSESEDTSSVPFGSQFRAKSVDLNLEADECINESNPSSFASYPSLGGYGLSYWEINSNMEVVLLPDYLIYQDNYYLGLKITFSKSQIQINYAIAFESQGPFNIELAVDDLIDIKSQLFQSNATVMMMLSVRSRNTNQTSRVSCTSGIEEMKFVVVDPNWSLTMNRIISLNSKYSTVWKTAAEVDAEVNEYFSRRTTSYFPDFEVMPFDEIVYPKGERDAVYLSKSDVDLLQPNTYINDSVIDFYVQYLKSKIPKDERSRYHFFNSFFFRKLADLDKDPSSACDGKAAFQRVRSWTRKVNLFEKDYIFIPVNFNFHWSLLVICHPGEVVNLNDNELDRAPRVPCILHMDSVKGYHCGLKNLMQSYLNEEWKERQKNTFGEDLSSRFLNMRFLPVAVPQQQNNYDCGLFLLHYLELFLAEAPLNFNPLKLSKFSNFLNLDWFQPAEAYLKRAVIQRVIFEVVKNNGSHEDFSFDDSGDLHCLESNDNSTGSHCHIINGESSTSYSDKKIEMTVLPSSPVLEEFFEPGAAVRSSGYDLSGSMFPMKEAANLNEKEISPLTSSVDNVRAESSRGVSSYVLSDSDDDIEIIGSFPVQNEARPFDWKLPDINGSADVNIPVYSFMEIPPPSNSSYSENNLSYQEKEAFVNMEPDTCEEQANSLSYNGSHEDFSFDDSGDHHYLESNDNSTGSHCHVINGESSASYSDKQIEMTVLLSSPVLEEFFEPGAAVRSSGYDLSGSMFPMKEVANLNEKEISPLTSSVDNVRAESSRGVSSYVLSDSDDDVEIIGSFSVQNEARSFHQKLPDINGSADVNIPVYSFMEIPPPSNSSYSENNLSYQEKEAFVNMEPDTSEEQAKKKRRLLPFLSGSDGVLTKSYL